MQNYHVTISKTVGHLHEFNLCPSTNFQMLKVIDYIWAFKYDVMTKKYNTKLLSKRRDKKTRQET